MRMKIKAQKSRIDINSRWNSNGHRRFLATATVGVSLFYKPYRSAYYQTKKMKVVSKRDQLIKERLAEQALQNAYSTARKIEHLSVWTNFAASAGILSQAEKNSTKIIAVMAGISSFFLTYFLTDGKQLTSRHEKYKKKIYGPIARGDIIFNKQTNSLAPALKLSYNF